MTANQMIKKLKAAGFDMSLITKVSTNIVRVSMPDQDDNESIDWIGTAEATKKASDILGGVWWIQAGYGACELDARRYHHYAVEEMVTADAI